MNNDDLTKVRMAVSPHLERALAVLNGLKSLKAAAMFDFKVAQIETSLQRVRHELYAEPLEAIQKEAKSMQV